MFVWDSSMKRQYTTPIVTTSRDLKIMGNLQTRGWNMGKCGVNWCIYSFERPTQKASHSIVWMDGPFVCVCVRLVGWHSLIRTLGTPIRKEKRRWPTRTHIVAGNICDVLRSGGSSWVGLLPWLVLWSLHCWNKDDLRHKWTMAEDRIMKNIIC